MRSVENEVGACGTIVKRWNMCGGDSKEDQQKGRVLPTFEHRAQGP